MRKAHQKLEIWQESMQLVVGMYRETEGFPAAERFGLTNQLRRAAVSIPSNIAEGAARETTKEFRRYLYIARGSIAEVDTQLRIAASLGYMPSPQAMLQQNERLFAKTNSLIATLKRNTA